DVDTNSISIDGISLGGYMTVMLCSLLDLRVHRAFSLFGCGYHALDTLFTTSLLTLSDEDRASWLSNLDVSGRIHRIRATFLLFAASNDSYFRPPSVNAT